MSNSSDPDQADVLLGLIWVQTVCKVYQQMTKATISGERVQILNGMAKSVDPDHEQSDLGLHYLPMPFYQQLWHTKF